MEALYVESEYALDDKVEYAKGNLKPSMYWGRSPEGARWERRISCGHNPFLEAFQVDDLVVTRTPEGKEEISYKLRESPFKRHRELPGAIPPDLTAGS